MYLLIQLEQRQETGWERETEGMTCSKRPQVGAEPWDSEDKASVHQGRLQYLLQYCRFVFKVWLRGCCTWGHESEMCVCVCNSPAPDAFKQNMCSLFSFLFFTSELIFFIYKTPKWRYPPGNLLWKLWAAFTSAKIYKMTGRPPAGYYVKPCVLK